MASAHHSAPPPQAQAHGHQRIRRLDEKVAAQVWATVVLSSVDQVLAQLVYNSLDAGATIIQAALHPAALWLSVTDNGIGILPADLPLLGMSSHSSKSPPAHQVDSAAARPPSYPRYHGYRGQAFAALTTVALVQVSSKHESSSQARSFIERIAVAYPTVAFSLHDCRTQKLVVTVPPCPTSIDTLRHLSGASAVPPDKCHSFATTISNPFSPIAISGWWFNTRFPQGLAFVNREPCLDAPLHTILVRLLESRFQAVDFGFICLIRCSREISLDITRLRLIISSSLDTQLNPSPPNSAPSMAASRPSTSPLTAYPHSFTLSDTSSRPHSCSTTFFQPPRLPLRKAQSSGTICESAGRSRSSIRRLGRSASGGRLDDGPPPGFTQLASVFIDPRTGNSVFATSPARHDSSASSASASHSLYSPRSRESRPRSTPSRDGSTASSTVSKTSAASTTASSLQATRLAIESVVSHASSQHTSTLSSRFFRVARQVATRSPFSDTRPAHEICLSHAPTLPTLSLPRDCPSRQQIHSGLGHHGRSRHALIAVDQHAADERVRLEELLAQADREINEHGGLAMTPLAEVLVMGDVPVHVARVFRERREWLMRWGIWAEEEEVQAQADETCPAPSSIFVRAIPTLVTSRLARDPSSITDLIFALLAEPHESTLIQTSTPPPPVLHMLHSIACRSAIMFGDPLTLEAGELLWRALTQTRTVERSDWGRGGAARYATPDLSRFF
ncbi:hypothetical protein BCR44DRAFT_1498032 [Catenaria anguillulae PL171]|uniref:MutL C-terminal dimerisation domain-containing protein n=1 Tax=Catenaria anguillulae PL171 TaxID=765915 RepID=A0A1Y2HSL3_9FUNG|nr:hypothetical protein BCR44DRAFT_1498032 [Catenaria anguillulae PL171]